MVERKAKRKNGSQAFVLLSACMALRKVSRKRKEWGTHFWHLCLTPLFTLRYEHNGISSPAVVSDEFAFRWSAFMVDEEKRCHAR